MSEHQTKEHGLYKRQNIKMKKKYEENVAELTAIEALYEKATEELEYFRKKDALF